jgi:hypothetical protein
VTVVPSKSTGSGDVSATLIALARLEPKVATIALGAILGWKSAAETVTS